MEFYNFLPLVVKKDKNLSTSMYYIMNSNKSSSYKKNLEDLKKSIKNVSEKDRTLKKNLEMI